MKRSALQNKQIEVLRMAFRARKVFGTFAKRAPGPLADIFNMSAQKGVFPSKLKQAKVIPVYKSDDDTERGNHRPISLISIFNRIFEKLMYHCLKSFPDKKRALGRKA